MLLLAIVRVRIVGLILPQIDTHRPKNLGNHGFHVVLGNALPRQHSVTVAQEAFKGSPVVEHFDISKHLRTSDRHALDFLLVALGDIVFVDITTEGETLGKGEVFGTIEVVKTVSDLFLPIGGEVLEVNPELEEHPELVNQDPYGEGWLVKIKPVDIAELDDLLDVEAYKQIINE